MGLTGKPWKRDVRLTVSDQPGISVNRPKRYWIPDAWAGVVVPILRSHGIQVDTGKSRDVELSLYRVESYELGKAPFEGRTRVDTATFKTVRQTLRARNSVPVDQALGDLAMVLLEPASPDSLFRWGFFNSIFQRTWRLDPACVGPRGIPRLPATRQKTALLCCGRGRSNQR